jgi:hypothetical protein
MDFYSGKDGSRLAELELVEDMVELIIESWGSLDGGNHYLWSVWQDGKRIEMSGLITGAESAEALGRAWCEKSLGRQPDRVIRL